MTRNYAKWFIELKKYLKNNFQEILKDFIKNDFELMILIYLFTKKRSSNLFSINDLIQLYLYLIFKKSYLHLLYQKNLLQNFNLITKIIFTCFCKKWMNFYNFIYKKNIFPFVFISKKWFIQIIKKNITLFTKEFLIKIYFLGQLYL